MVFSRFLLCGFPGFSPENLEGMGLINLISQHVHRSIIIELLSTQYDAYCISQCMKQKQMQITVIIFDFFTQTTLNMFVQMEIRPVQMLQLK